MAEKSVAAKTVRVSVPASVADDIGSLKKAFATVLDRLGCPACCSGMDIFWELQRDVMFTRKLTDSPRFAPAMRIAMEQRAPNTVTVGVAPEAVSTLDDVFVALERIAEISGHPACATGCDMRFQMERIFVLDAKVGLEEQVMRVG